MSLHFVTIASWVGGWIQLDSNPRKERTVFHPRPFSGAMSVSFRKGDLGIQETDYDDKFMAKPPHCL